MNKIVRKVNGDSNNIVESINKETVCSCFYSNIPVIAKIGLATQSKKSFCVPIVKKNKTENRSVPDKVCLDNLVFNDFRRKSKIKKSLQNYFKQNS